MIPSGPLRCSEPTKEDAEPEGRGEGRSSDRMLLYTGARAASRYSHIIFSADLRELPKEEEITIVAKEEAEPEGRYIAVKLCEGLAEMQEEIAVLDSISEDGALRPKRAFIGSTSDDGTLPSTLTVRWEGRAVAGSRGGAVYCYYIYTP